jgi:hypothetical protein
VTQCRQLWLRSKAVVHVIGIWSRSCSAASALDVVEQPVEHLRLRGAGNGGLSYSSVGRNNAVAVTLPAVVLYSGGVVELRHQYMTFRGSI